MKLRNIAIIIVLLTLALAVFSTAEENVKINLESNKTHIIEYYTEAPRLIDNRSDQGIRTLEIRSARSYKGIKTYIDIPETKHPKDIYKLSEANKTKIEATAIDTNGDGYYDRMEWYSDSGDNFETETLNKTDVLGRLSNLSQFTDASERYDKIDLKGRNVNLIGIQNISDIKEVFVGEINSSETRSEVLAVSEININIAEISLKKIGEVDVILSCDDFNFTDSSCSNWTQTSIPFSENSTHIFFNVTHFSAYSGGFKGGASYGYHLVIANIEEIAANGSSPNYRMTLSAGEKLKGKATSSSYNGSFGYVYLLGANRTIFGGQPADTALLTCNVTSIATCSFLDVFHISATSGALAEYSNQSNYGYSVCCRSRDEEIKIGNECNGDYSALLNLQSETTSLAEQSTQSNYNRKLCMNTTAGIQCDYRTDCTGYDTCVFSISGTTAANIGDCDAYPTKLCCNLYNDTGVYVSVTLKKPTNQNSSINFSNIKFNCSAETDNPKGLKNISLYTSYNGSWNRIETRQIRGTKNSTIFTRNIYSDNPKYASKFIDNTYKYNCLAYTNDSMSAWGQANYTFSSWSLGNKTGNISINRWNISLQKNSSGYYRNTSSVYVSRVYGTGNYQSWNNLTWNATTTKVNPDPYTKLLLHFNGSNGGTSFTDVSGQSHVMTANGGVKINSSQSRFEGTSAYFDGHGDYITTADSDDWNFGSGDFTVDTWVRLNKTTTGNTIFVQGNDASNMIELYWWGAGQKWDFRIYQSDTPLVIAQGPDSLSANQWYHIAIVRKGNNLAIYRNGKLKNLTTTSITEPDFTGSFVIGRWLSGSFPVNNINLTGYLDEFRVTKGVARWIANFTPPNCEYYKACPPNASIRTSDDAASWTSWKSVSNPSGLMNQSAKYFQYKLNLSTTHMNISPTVRWLNISYSPPTSLTLTSVNITPKSPHTNDTLNCSVDVESDGSFNASFRWYVNNNYNITWNSTINCSAGSICYTTKNITRLVRGYNYTCSAFVKDLTSSTEWKNSTAVRIINSYPLKVNLSYPPKNDSFFTDRKPRFNWTYSSDYENDLISYNFLLSTDKDFTTIIRNTTTTNNSYQYPAYLSLTTQYFWKVRANDSYNHSQWSVTWNFTIQPSTGIVLLNNTIEFGTVAPSQQKNTSFGSPPPFRIRNTGNLEIDINMSATDLFTTVALGTKYFQVKVNITDEGYSFNMTSSQVNWTNITSGNLSVFRSLNYTDDSDEALIDLYVLVPDAEPPGTLSTNLTFYAGASD